MAPLTSCKNCHFRHVKCDKGTPCATCVSKGEQSLCNYEKVLVQGREMYVDENGRTREGKQTIAIANMETENIVSASSVSSVTESSTHQQMEEVLFHAHVLLRPEELKDMPMPSALQKEQFIDRLRELWTLYENDDLETEDREKIAGKIGGLTGEIRRVRLAGWRPLDWSSQTSLPVDSIGSKVMWDEMDTGAGYVKDRVWLEWQRGQGMLQLQAGGGRKQSG